MPLTDGTTRPVEIPFFTFTFTFVHDEKERRKDRFKRFIMVSGTKYRNEILIFLLLLLGTFAYEKWVSRLQRGI